MKNISLAVIFRWNWCACRAASWARVIWSFGCVAALFCVASTTRAQSSQVTPNNQTGIVSYNTYAGDHENVNLATSDLNVALPLVSLPGRNHHDVALSLLYDSHQWELTAVVDPFYGFLGYGWTAVDGGGWRLNAPRISGMTFHCDPMGDFFDTYVGDFIITLPDGDKHHFSNTANHAYHESACDGLITSHPAGQSLDYSADGSLLKFDTSTADAVLHLKDGSSIVFHDYLGTANQVDWKDSDGNIITYAYSGANLVSVTDTLGRVVNVSSTGITYPDGSGIQQSITFGYSNQTIAPTFSQPSSMFMAYNPGSQVVSTLSSVTLANGRSYGMQYNNFGEVTKITYPSGGYTRYAYGALQGWYLLNQNSTSGDVRVVTNAYSCAKSSGSCTAAEENVTTYSATRQQSNSNNTAMTVTDPLGNYTVYTFTDAGTPSGFVAGCQPPSPRELTRTMHDSSGATLRSIATDYNTTPDCGNGTTYMFPIRKTTTLDDGKVTKTEWDYDTLSGFGSSYLADNVKEERVFDYGNLSVPAVKHKFTYLKANPVNSVDYQSTLFILDRKASEQIYDSHTGTDVLMAQTTYEYDSYTAGLGASGATKQDSAYATGYTTRGNVTAVNHWRNTDGAWLTTRNQYDDAGNVLSATDPLSHLTQFSYADNFTDGINHNGKAYVTQITYPPTGSVNHIERKQYYYGGLLAASCGQNFPSGSVCANTYGPPEPDYAKYSYDGMDRLLQVTFGDGGGKSMTYNDAPPFSSTTNVPLTSGASGISLTTAATMDGLGRTVQARLTSDPLGTDYTDTTYDALGRPATVSNPYRSTSDSTYGNTTSLFDGLGRITQITKQDGSIASNAYTGNCTLSTDEAGKQKKACSDALGRLTTVFEDPNGLNYETDYQYDALNNLTRVDQKGTAPSDSTQWRTRLFTYNSLSQLLTASNPESGTISYLYDADGNVQTKTDPRVTTTFNYDALNRVTSKSYSDGTTSTAHFLYDIPSTWGYTITYVIGRLSEAYIDTCPDGAGNKSGGNSIFSYDVMGRVILHAQSTPSNCGTAAWTVTAGYDLAGNMTSLNYPSGRNVTNQFDAASRLNRVQYKSWQGVTYSYGTYDYLNVSDFFPSGAPKSATLGSGMVESYQFNPRLQPSRDTVNMPGGNTFLDRTYGYGTQNNGNVMNVADQLNSAYTQNFTYDPLNRLATAAEAGSRWGYSFGYDAWGNFLQQNLTAGTGSGHSYLATTTNRLGGYTYDAAGNMAADDHHQYAYDGENRITTVDITGAKYGYDANGNRVRKDVGSNYTEYIYFGSEIIAEHDQAGGWSDYIFANGKRIAKADDYEHQIQVSGQVCSACGTQTYSLAFSSLGSLAGHVVQSGDILRWQQWQNTGTVGGITVTMTDGTKSVSIGSAANQWQSFAVDLSTLQGKTISSIALYEDPSTQPGAWTLYYQDIVFTAANGAVQPLFSQNPTVPALTGSGTSGVTSVTTAIHICLDPGCAPANTTTYYHGDQIGSSRLLSNGHGYPVWQGTFLPFGEEYNQQITDNHYKFTGKERDTESNLDYFGARYYSNGLGRWISADWSAVPVPVPYADFANPQSLNLYSYVRNVPETRIDPDGHCDIKQKDGTTEHHSGWCVFHKLGFYETKDERSARIDQERATLLDPKRTAHENGKPLTPAERYRIEHMTPEQIDSTYNAIQSQGIQAGTPPPISAPGGGSKWNYGSNKSAQKWQNQMSQRGWTEQQIDEAIDKGQQFPATNNINPANGATRYVNPSTGRSVVVDNVTRELIHVGGDGFKY